MNTLYQDRFKRELKSCPQVIRRKFYKQAGYLLENLRHPSLHTKKYNEKRGIWQARVDRNYRFYFLIERDTYVLLAIRRHTKK